ncbi:MAG: hypothetical protein MHM6MM_000462 [Cercozoa sp. M6MM]
MPSTPRCHECALGIAHGQINALSKFYHYRCWTCKRCSKQLRPTEPFYAIPDKDMPRKIKQHCQKCAYSAVAFHPMGYQTAGELEAAKQIPVALETRESDEIDASGVDSSGHNYVSQQK